MFLAWAAYDAIEPIGGRRDDWHTAALLAMYANRHRNSAIFPKPFHARDFILNFEAEAAAAPVQVKQPKSATQLFAQAKNIAALYNRLNAQDKRKAQERIERPRRTLTGRGREHGKRG